MRRGCALSVIAVIVLLMAMVVTCPKARDHKEVLKIVLREVIEEKIDDVVSRDMLGSVVKLAGNMAMGSTSDYAIDRFIRVDDYFLFSVGRLRIGTTDRVVSIGVFNHVFAPDKDDILNSVKRYGL